VCEDDAQALLLYGPVVAGSLKNRVGDLRAASHVFELPAIRPRFGEGPDIEHLIIDLADGYTLFLAANHPKPPRDGDGAINWQRVSRVRLLRIDSPENTTVDPLGAPGV